MGFHIAAVVDLLGVGFLAASGAIAAAERRQDIVTFIFFGAMTGIGGGTLRDLLIGQPVFWVHTPAYLIVCVAAAAAIWVFSPRLIPAPALLWADAIGLCAYAVVGAQKASALRLDGSVCVAMGVLTACFGGIIRDLLAGQPSVLLRREIYITPAILAATLYIGLESLGVDHGLAISAGVVVGLLVRGCALIFGWTLPAFPHKPISFGAPAREEPLTP